MRLHLKCYERKKKWGGAETRRLTLTKRKIYLLFREDEKSRVDDRMGGKRFDGFRFEAEGEIKERGVGTKRPTQIWTVRNKSRAEIAETSSPSRVTTRVIHHGSSVDTE